MTPTCGPTKKRKSREQLLKNYSKNKGAYAQIRFVDTSENHAQQVREILGEEWLMRDPERLQVRVVDFEDLNKIEPGNKTEEAEGGQEGQPKQTLGRAEEVVLSLVIAGGYTSREELAKKCSEAGLDVGERSVSRYLRNLTDGGLLKRVGNGYEPTEQSRKLSGQGTL